MFTDCPPLPHIYAAHITQLERLIGARGPDPLVFVPEPDDAWLRAHLEGAWKGDIWTIDGAGRRERRAKGAATWRLQREGGHADFLKEAASHPGPAAIFWLRDLPDPLPAELRGRLKALGTYLRESGSESRVLVSGVEVRPTAALRHLTRLEPLARPGPGHIDELVRAWWSGPQPSDAERRGIRDRLRGLDASEIVALVRRASASSEADALTRVQRLRDGLIGTGALVVVPRRDELEVGGLRALQNFLADTRALRDDRRANEKDERLSALIPKGMLLLGLPGCGKSLAAELTAKVFDEPLLQLHAGRLMGKYLGDSEGALDAALAAARAAQPCVLWIDELEKAVGGFSSDEGGGTGGRLLGTLLSWMQENREVFVVATTNGIEKLPSELLRRGRFDEHFVIHLPNEEERAEILEAKLSRLGTRDEALVASLAKRTDKYSGADLEGLVAEAARRAQLRRRTCAPRAEDFEPLLNGEGEFRPQAVQLGDQHERLKAAVDKYKFRSASAAKGTQPLSSARAAAEPPLPPVLERLISVRDEVVVRWQGGTLHFFSYGEQRRARLGPKGVTTVADGFEREVYRLARFGNVLVLNAIGEKKADVPRQLTIQARHDGFEVDGQEAVSEAVRASGSLPPELWGWLGGELKGTFSGLSVVSMGKGVERRIAMNRDAATPLAHFRVELDADKVLLVPERVFSYPSWAQRSDAALAFMQGARVRWEADSVKLVPERMGALAKPNVRTWKIKNSDTWFELHDERTLFVKRWDGNFVATLGEKFLSDATCSRWRVQWEGPRPHGMEDAFFQILSSGNCSMAEHVARPVT
jgi:hypothetical protein